MIWHFCWPPYWPIVPQPRAWPRPRTAYLPLEPLSCPVDQAFLMSIGLTVHAAYREARRAGDSAAMLRIRLEVQRERAEWALRWGSAVS